MKHLLAVFFGSMVLSLTAQHTISGTFSPAKDYKWLIAYRLEPGTQSYIADTSIKGGKFTLNIPENAQTGTYRMVYAVPQEEYYFDVIYDGKEAIELAFNATDGVSFIISEENKLFNSYFKDINALEREIIHFYSAGKTDKKEFKNIISRLQETQTAYETRSKGLISHIFITANNPYVPSKSESVQEYVENKKQQYFNGLDFKNPILQSSGFLTDKVVNYVFTALPLGQISQEGTEAIMQENIKKANDQLQGIDAKYKTHLFYTLWAQTEASGFNSTSDFMYHSFLKHLALEMGNQEIIDKIELNNRLRFGATAPEITWQDNGSTKKLNELENAENYILVFWSSTCSHCLNELPKLHKSLYGNPTVKVLAVGLEKDAITWKQESAKLDGFIHAISLGKWDSEYAHLYDIHQTPTYFILDKDKKIVAKPEDYNEVMEFLKKK